MSFRFSRDLEANNKHSHVGSKICFEEPKGSHLAETLVPHICRHTSKPESDSVSECSKRDKKSGQFSEKQVFKDSIVSSLDRTAESASEFMSNISHVQLPFFRKAHVYECFCCEYSAMYCSPLPSRSYFFANSEKPLPPDKGL